MYTLFAATYGQSTYGGDVYSATATSTETGTPSTPQTGDTLPATGMNITFGLIGGILLVVIATTTLVVLWRKKKAARNV